MYVEKEEFKHLTFNCRSPALSHEYLKQATCGSTVQQVQLLKLRATLHSTQGNYVYMYT